MPQLLVRDLEEKVVRKLKQRAGEHGISTEEEHRRILREALFPEQKKDRPSFMEHLMSMPDVGSDDVFERQKDYGRDIDL
jgi:plasmid stability protein